MRLRKRDIAFAVLVLALCLGAQPVFGGERQAAKPAPGKIVDSGSFGIFVNGKRIGTEKFQIEQQPTVSIIASEVSVDDGKIKAGQSAELKLSPNGDVQRYTWRELSPGKAQAVVEADKDLLIQHISATPNAKAEDQPYILPPSTTILDDYFFSHRQVLAWRYLASACPSGQTPCNPQPSQYPVLVPRERISMMVTMTYGGREKLTLRGSQQEFDRVNLQADAVDWILWLDVEHKLVRISIPSANIEILRD